MKNVKSSQSMASTMVTVQMGIGEELRIECGEDGVDVMLLEGVAEYLGGPLPIGYTFVLPPRATRVLYSPGGASVRLDPHDALQPPVLQRQPHGMSAYYAEHIHHLVQSVPFRVVLICRKGSGIASTLAQLICNRSILRKHNTLLVDADPSGATLFNIPGTIGSVLVEGLLPIEEGFSAFVPLVFGVGTDCSGQRFETACGNLALGSALVGMSERPNQQALGGVAVLTTVETSKAVLSVCKAFEPTAIYTVGLHPDSVTSLRSALSVPKTGGGASENGDGSTQDQPVRETFCFPSLTELPTIPMHMEYNTIPKSAFRLREYFFGTRTPLMPVTAALVIDDIQLFHISSDNARQTIDILEHVETLQNRILALSHAQDEDEVSVANLAGFVAVLGIDPEGRTISLMMPATAPLPSPFFILLDAYICSDELIP